MAALPASIIKAYPSYTKRRQAIRETAAQLFAEILTPDDDQATVLRFPRAAVIMRELLGVA